MQVLNLFYAIFEALNDTILTYILYIINNC